jgi:hypothetical protein
MKSMPLLLGSSFCEVARNSYLDGLVHDLPEVNLASLSTVEPIVQSAKEQVCVALMIMIDV